MSGSYSRFTCTALSISLGTWTTGRCLVSATVAEIKRHLLFFDYAARAYCFSPFEILMSLIIERSHHCSACLLTTSTRCQNRSTPFLDTRLHGDFANNKITPYPLSPQIPPQNLTIFNYQPLPIPHNSLYNTPTHPANDATPSPDASTPSVVRSTSSLPLSSPAYLHCSNVSCNVGTSACYRQNGTAITAPSHTPPTPRTLYTTHLPTRAHSLGNTSLSSAPPSPSPVLFACPSLSRLHSHTRQRRPIAIHETPRLCISSKIICRNSVCTNRQSPGRDVPRLLPFHVRCRGLHPSYALLHCELYASCRHLLLPLHAYVSPSWSSYPIHSRQATLQT